MSEIDDILSRHEERYKDIIKAPTLTPAAPDVADWSEVLGAVPEYALGGIKTGVGGLMEAGGELFGAEGLVESGRELGHRARLEMDAETPENLSFWQEATLNAAQSLGISLPGLMASIATGNPWPGLIAMGAGEFGHSYSTARREGLDEGQATLFAGINSVIEIATEKIPMGILLNRATPFFKRLVHLYGAELVQENIATTLQSANEFIQLQPDATFNDWINYLATEGIPKTTASTLISSTVQGNLAGLAHRGMARMKDDYAKAQVRDEFSLALENASKEERLELMQGMADLIRHGEADPAFNIEQLRLPGIKAEQRGRAKFIEGSNLPELYEYKPWSRRRAAPAEIVVHNIKKEYTKIMADDYRAAGHILTRTPMAQGEVESQNGYLDVITGDIRKALSSWINNSLADGINTMSVPMELERVINPFLNEAINGGYISFLANQSTPRINTFNLNKEMPVSGDNRHFFVSEGDSLIGGTYGPFGAILDTFAIAENDRRKNIGNTLMEETMRALHQKGVRSVNLTDTPTPVVDAMDRLAVSGYFKDAARLSGRLLLPVDAEMMTGTVKLADKLPKRDRGLKTAREDRIEYEFIKGKKFHVNITPPDQVDEGMLPQLLPKFEFKEFVQSTPDTTIVVQQPTKRERRVITAAIQDLMDAGMPANVLQLVDNFGVGGWTVDTIGGTFYPNADGKRFIYLNRGRIQRVLQGNEKAAVKLRWELAHELGHAISIADNNDFAPISMEYQPQDSHLRIRNAEYWRIDPDGLRLEGDTLAWDKGSLGYVMEELVNMYDRAWAQRERGINEPPVLLSYPIARMSELIGMSGLGSGMQAFVNVTGMRPALIRHIHGESFAQAFALYMTHPDLLLEQAPKLTAYMEGYLNAINQTKPSDTVSDRLRAAVRAPSPEVGVRGDAGRQTPVGAQTGFGDWAARWGVRRESPTGPVWRNYGQLPETVSYEFFSPNEQENITFNEAQRHLRTKNFASAVAMSEDIDRNTDHETLIGIGDWADGAEESIVTKYHGEDYDHVKYTAALKGLAFNQKAVIPFTAEAGGPSIVWEMDINAPIMEVRQALIEEGIEYRTLVPADGATKVLVFEEQATGELAQKIHNVGDRYGAEAKYTEGRGEFLGGETRAEGRRAFEEVKTAFEEYHAREPRYRTDLDRPAEAQKLTDEPWRIQDFEGIKQAKGRAKTGDYAGDPDKHSPINVKNIDGPEKLKAMADKIVRDFYPEFKKKTRGVVPQRATIETAEALGLSEKELEQVARTKRWDAATLYAARDMSLSALEDVTAAADLAELTGSYEDKVAFEKAMAEYVYIASNFAGLASETGRALNILRTIGSAKDYGALAEKLESTTHTADKIAMVQAFQHDRQKVAKFAKESMGITVKDVLMEMWINALLSGPQTHAVNIMSTALMGMVTDLDHLVAAGIGKLHGGEKVYVREATSRAFATVQGAKEALSGLTFEPHGAQKIERRIYRTITAENFGADPKKITGKAIDIVGKVIRGPGSFLTLEDNVFKMMVTRKSLWEQAQHEAIKRGLTGTEKAEYARNLAQNPTPKMEKKAWKDAEYSTFTSKPGPLASALIRAANRHPLLKIIAPFINTPTNIVKVAAEHSPFAIGMESFREGWKQGGRERDIALAKMFTGSSIGAMVVALAAQGLISGGGPTEPRERQAWYRMGWQPYSVRIGDKWYSYARLEPLGMVMGVSADFAMVQNYIDQDRKDELAGLIMGSIMKNLTSKTWLRGMSELVKALDDPDRYGEYWLRNFLGTAIPTGVAQVARTEDEYLRQAQTLTEHYKTRIPGYRQQVAPRLNLWGQPIAYEGGVGFDLMSPIYFRTISRDPATEALAKLGYFPGKPSKRVGGIELTPEQYNDYIRLAGVPTHRILSALVASDFWTRQMDYRKKEIVEDIFRTMRRQARNILYLRYPNIRRQQLEALAQEMRQ